MSAVDELAAVPPALRREVGRIWAERTRTELGAGSGFAQVVVQLYAIGARAEVLTLATEAAHQELEHAESCRALAERYLGEPIALPRPQKVELPEHAGATDSLRATLHVIGLSCINETLAAEFVARCLDHAELGFVREATSRHLRDEIGHARVGWAHLASGVLDAQDRDAVAGWLPRLISANAAHWLARVRELPKDGVRGHGYPPVAELEAGIRRGLREIILPGFSHVGIDATLAERAIAEV